MKTAFVFALSFLVLPAIAAPPVDTQLPLQRIAFGSCVHQDKPQPIWQAVLADAPDLFVFLGDNIYADTRNMEELSNKYQQLARVSGFSRLRESLPAIAIWDDHDYGENDAGAEYPEKQASRKIMLDFWEEPPNSDRRTRKDGIYTSYMLGPPGRRVQLILLDLRWNRTALKGVGTFRYQLTKAPKNLGPYEANDDPDAQLLGESQWRWLEQQLVQPAELRIIGSSIQLLAEFTGWESWANFPNERQRLLGLLKSTKSQGTLIISGDTHWSEFSRLDGVLTEPLWEATSSGLTEEWKAVSPNRHRIGEAYAKANYGMIEIDWDKRDAKMSIRDVNGKTVMKKTAVFME